MACHYDLVVVQHYIIISIFTWYKYIIMIMVSYYYDVYIYSMAKC